MLQHSQVLMFLKKTPPLVIEEKNILPEKLHHSWEMLQKIYCLSTAKITKKTGKTRLMSQCQRLQIKLQVEAKHRTSLKNLLKTCFQKKGDPFWTQSRKDWNNLPYFFPRKYHHTQINKRGNTAALKNGGFWNVSFEKQKQKSCCGSYLKLVSAQLNMPTQNVRH